MEGLHWAIIRREDAVKILEETERQVLATLVCHSRWINLLCPHTFIIAQQAR